MKIIAPIAIVALLAGCISSTPVVPVTWNIEADTSLVVSSITVNAPYDGSRFVVLRSDGSVAFDAYNGFAARTPALVKAAVTISPDGPELVVRRLALDCRAKDERNAVVELALRNREKVLSRAQAKVPTADGDYTKAFSSAFTEAADKLAAGVKR